MRIVIAGIVIAAAATANAQSTVGLTLGTEHLSNSTPDWREASVQLQHQYAARHGSGLAFARTERFGLQDRQLSANYARPFGEKLVVSVDANASSTHRVLARHGIGAALQFEFAPAWLVHAGARTTKYADERVNQGLLMLEHYFSSFSASIGWRPARAFDSTAHSGELRGAYYYGDRNSVGLILAGGKEAASIAGAVTLTSLRSAAVVGRHWLNRDWAVNYSAGHTRQGDFYSRNGISLGLQYAF
ncbi:YaiO family outer membrane beta-barrel protein [Noviherbaspirillum sp. ST9]|uniref:YaiO family outer membrane beta-barrel protein n=1 Tax=Noviherbaspirillum sp. ST9 TaxID=3401606 RepID=UPI003B586921